MNLDTKIKKINKLSDKQKIVLIISFLIIATGIATTSILLHSKINESKNTFTENDTVQASNLSSGIISAGGTITAGNISERLNFSSTDISLVVDEIYVESGNTIAVGDSILKITPESLSTAKETLEKELQSAKNNLLTEEISYNKSSNTAYALYQSQIGLTNTALSDFDSQISNLDEKLQNALDSYNDAEDIIDKYPNTIKVLKTEITSLNSDLSVLNTNLTKIQSTQNTTKLSYDKSINNYNKTVDEYNSAVLIYKYVSTYLGYDVSDIKLAEIVNDTTSSSDNSNEAENQTDQSNQQDNQPNTPEIGDNSNITLPAVKNISSLNSDAENIDYGSDNDINAFYKQTKAEYEKLKKLYENKLKDYQQNKAAYLSAKENTVLEESKISELKSEIKELGSTKESLENGLTNAKKNLSSLKLEYQNTKLSYDGNILTLKNEYNIEVSTYKNAKHNYDLTMSTLDSTLEEANKTLQTAESNLKIFNSTLSDGIVKSTQSGTISSINYESDDIISILSPVVTYVDDATFETTVELTQDQITTVSIGDTVIMYSSELGTCNGTISSMSEGTAESLSKVSFKVTIKAEDGTTGLYSGESVNVYFNVDSLTNMIFSDAENQDSSSQNGENGMPSLNNMEGMPDMSNIPNMPDMTNGQ